MKQRSIRQPKKDGTGFNVRFLIICFVAFTSLCILNGRVYGQSAGIVIEQSGSWQAAGRNLSPNSSVNAGETIRNISGAKTDYIGILDRQSGATTRKNCRTDNCSQGFALSQRKTSASKNSYFSTVWGGVYTWFFGDPRYVPALTRSGAWRETVLKIDKGKVDLTPFLETIDEGVYTLNFTPVVTEPGDSRQVLEIKTRRDKKNKGNNNVEGLSPGIYELFKADEPPVMTWVLVVPSDKYKKAAKEFAEITKITEQWEKEGITSQTIKTFRRVHMNYLAQKYAVAEKK